MRKQEFHNVGADMAGCIMECSPFIVVYGIQVGGGLVKHNFYALVVPVSARRNESGATSRVAIVNLVLEGGDS